MKIIIAPQSFKGSLTALEVSKIIAQAVINNLGALIFDANRAKSNYLIDDVLNLNEVINQVVEELNLKNYKIIEKKINTNIVKSFFQTFLLFKYDINKIKNNRICNIINNYTNVILLDNNFINNC